MLDGLIPIEIDDETTTRYIHWYGSNPEFAKHLRTWGEAGTVKVKTKTTPKINDRGVQCMFVGYALNHPGDCYRMWDPKTGRVHETQDIIWLKRMFYEKSMKKNDIIVHQIEIEDTEDQYEDTPDTEVGEGNNNNDNESQDEDEDESEEDEDVEDEESDYESKVVATTRSG